MFLIKVDRRMMKIRILYYIFKINYERREYKISARYDVDDNIICLRFLFRHPWISK